MTAEPLPARRPRLLSDREIEVLTLWLASESKREVAQALYISDATVHTHLARIRAKYQSVRRPANTKIALLIRAIEDGYLTLNDIARRIGVDPSESAGAAIIAVVD
ncbi:response regulator transcription factor [Gordonia sp. NPDC003424]